MPAAGAARIRASSQVGSAPRRHFPPFRFCRALFLFSPPPARGRSRQAVVHGVHARGRCGTHPGFVSGWFGAGGHRFLPFRFCRVLFILSAPRRAGAHGRAAVCGVHARGRCGTHPGFVSGWFGAEASFPALSVLPRPFLFIFSAPAPHGRSRQSGSMRCPCPRQVRHASGLRLRLVRRRWASFPTLSVLPRLVYFVRPRRAGAHGRAAVCGVHARGRCGTHPGFVSGWFGAEASFPALSVLPRPFLFIFSAPAPHGRSRQSGSMRCPCPRQVRHASGLRLRLVRRRGVASRPFGSAAPFFYFLRPRRAGAHGRR